MPRRQPGPFSLGNLGESLPKPLAAMVRAPLQSLLCLPKLNEVYADLTRNGPPEDLCGGVLDYFGCTVHIRDEDLARIPRSGPLMLVANHPFGGIDALIMTSLLVRLRPDGKMMANRLLGCVPEFRDICIFVDVFGSTEGRRGNVKAMKEALTWLRQGGAVGVFPSGEVAHLDPGQRRIVDAPWSEHIAGLVRRTDAVVLPMFFEGHNTPMFHVAGLIHPGLRTVLLPREMLHKQHATINVHIGCPITPADRDWCEDDRQLIDFLRLRTQALAGRSVPGGRRPHGILTPKMRKRARLAVFQPVAAAVDPELIEGDITDLPADALLASAGELCVFEATAGQLGCVLPELGRLRELTFREVGEGSGKPCDLDVFDEHYLHLVLWDRRAKELVGSYRLGLTDQIVPPRGVRGLYTSTLFAFGPELLERLGPSIELGRSFVRPEYQANMASLMLLWKGIGQFVARRPHYRRMLGPVSISNDYRPLSRAAIVAYLTHPSRISPLASLVKPRLPFDLRKAAGADVLRLVENVPDVDELNRLIQDIEPDGKGVPGLLRQYLKLGAKALAFNLDPEFNWCLDGLCVFDALQADRRTMRRYLGEEHIAGFQAVHGVSGEPGHGRGASRTETDHQ